MRPEPDEECHLRINRFINRSQITADIDAPIPAPLSAKRMIMQHAVERVPDENLDPLIAPPLFIQTQLCVRFQNCVWNDAVIAVCEATRLPLFRK